MLQHVYNIICYFIQEVCAQQVENEWKTAKFYILNSRSQKSLTFITIFGSRFAASTLLNMVAFFKSLDILTYCVSLVSTLTLISNELGTCQSWYVV